MRQVEWRERAQRILSGGVIRKWEYGLYGLVCGLTEIGCVCCAAVELGHVAESNFDGRGERDDHHCAGYLCYTIYFLLRTCVTVGHFLS